MEEDAEFGQWSCNGQDGHGWKLSICCCGVGGYPVTARAPIRMATEHQWPNMSPIGPYGIHSSSADCGTWCRDSRNGALPVGNQNGITVKYPMGESN